MTNLARRVGQALQRLEDLLLGGLLIGMILLAAYQIILRNCFDGGLIWGDEVLRILVLWTGLLGAATASRERRHITIDVLSRLLPERLQRWAGQLVALFTALISALIAWHAGRFVHAEFSYGATGPGGIPSAWFELVLPVSFALISLRYLVAFVRQVASGGSHEEAI
jgi:TRAP-type C4-dicarboxylate transport system permease small subunit